MFAVFDPSFDVFGYGDSQREHTGYVPFNMRRARFGKQLTHNLPLACCISSVLRRWFYCARFRQGLSKHNLVSSALVSRNITMRSFAKSVHNTLRNS